MEEIDKKVLIEHVKESNAIENIRVARNHHLFIDHLEAAALVARLSLVAKESISPRFIHFVLLKQELRDAGQFRRCKIWIKKVEFDYLLDPPRVSYYPKPMPKKVPLLMARWEQFLAEDLKTARTFNEQQKADLAWLYHHWFECIHPFRDGNGRTGRLILNNLRLILGLPWLIVRFDERQEYYRGIREWESGHKHLLEIKLS